LTNAALFSFKMLHLYLDKKRAGKQTAGAQKKTANGCKIFREKYFILLTYSV
jgi:hypothetical protein